MVETDGFVKSVIATITENFTHHPMTIDGCADQLNISRRTLQRRLSAARMTFTRLQNQVRLETATELLQNENLSIAEIATSLGYAKAANFARAFHRWVGVTPTEYRNQSKKR